jgi:uncharacterized protein YacL
MTHKNWLQENVAPLIALLFTGFTLFIYVMVLTKVISATENIAFLIINSVTNIMMIIVGYFFGSSAGSKAKQQAMDKMNDNTTSITKSVKTESTLEDELKS